MPNLRKSDRLLQLIGAFKLLKAASLVLVAAVAHKLLHGNVTQLLHYWAEVIRVDPYGDFVQVMIARITGLSPKVLKAVEAGTLIYAAVFIVEGIGLVRRKRWAEYITVGTTIALLPIEIIEILRHPTAVRVGLLVVNVAIVIYLVVNLRQKHAENAEKQA